MPDNDPTSRAGNLSEPAPGPDRLTEQEVALLECLRGCPTSCRGGGIAWRMDDGDDDGPARVQWLLDADRVLWLLELGVEMAKTGQHPAVIDRAGALLGWRFEGHERDLDEGEGAGTPEAGGDG
jgi:hypothetical protein